MKCILHFAHAVHLPFATILFLCFASASRTMADDRPLDLSVNEGVYGIDHSRLGPRAANRRRSR